MSPTEALELVASRPKGRAGFKSLVRELGLRGAERSELQAILDQLVSEGRLIENRRGHYKTPSSNGGLIAGRFSLHPRGFGFVTPPRPIPGLEGDLYIGRNNAGSAMHGDRVLAEVLRYRHDGRAEGRIRRILHHTQRFVVGQFTYSDYGCSVDPHDERVRERIEVLPGQEVPSVDAMGERLGNVSPPRVETAKDLDGMIVTMELTEFPTRTSPARGRVVEALGRLEDFGVDVEVVIRKHHVPYRFSEEALAEAESVPEELEVVSIEGRCDFRRTPVVTIDGETARDFDDAVWVEQLESGSFRLQVHIADVSHYVRPGAALDRDARERGNSTYFPDRAVPMLPGRLSTGICSLNPGVDRLTMSAVVEITPQGEAVKTELCRGVIRSAERMTYTNVYRVLEGDREALDRYAEHVDQFRRMRDLAKILIARRRKRGAIDLDLPEPVLDLDETGRMVGVRAADRNMAHRIVEEFMLAANEAVARHLERAGVGFLHRVHEPPSPKSVQELESVARQFGHSLGIEVAPKPFKRHRNRRDGQRHRGTDDEGGTVRSKDLQKFIERIEGLPEARVLSQRVLRSMKQARYSEEGKGHYALATKEYLHFTSPIRRYPDLVVHRVLGALIDGAKAWDVQGEAVLAEIADHCSMTERRSAAAERELLDWKRAKFMEDRMGDEFHGMITSVADSGFWVELEDLFIEGFVPIESFFGERFHYRDTRRQLVGARTKTAYGIGDRVRLRCDRVSFDRMKPEFSVLRALDTISDKNRG